MCHSVRTGEVEGAVKEDSVEIDWFTLIAQIVNFLILLFLLQHFLYDRVTGAMNERERRIASRLDDAQSKQRKAEEEARRTQQEREELEAQREQLMSQARKEAESRRDSYLEDARREVEERKARWQRAIEQQRKVFLSTLRDRVGEQVIATTRDVLEDLAGTELETGTVDTFVRYVRNMDEDEAKEFRSFVQSTDGKLKVRSSFDLPEEERKRIRDAVGEAAGRELDGRISFEKAPELLLGIELRSDGRTVGWNIDRYLDILANRLKGFLQQKQKGGEDG
jgi:F-type H+-transporting ATPase subunit b